MSEEHTLPRRVRVYATPTCRDPVALPGLH
jgi:hypothetical protein